MRTLLFLGTLAMCGLLPAVAAAQNGSGGTDAGTCVLHDHIYTCNGAAFQPMLAKAQTVAVDVHNADGVARSQLTSLLTKRLGKTIAANGGPSDLIFLLIPTESGVVYGHEDAPLGTLRVYSVTPEGYTRASALGGGIFRLARSAVARSGAWADRAVSAHFKIK